jgi:hypothetical protein
MKDLSFVLSIGSSEDGEIASRQLTVEWNKELETNMKVYHNLDLKNSISGILLDQIKESITLELIEELIDDALEVN